MDHAPLRKQDADANANANANEAGAPRLQRMASWEQAGLGCAAPRPRARPSVARTEKDRHSTAQYYYCV